MVPPLPVAWPGGLPCPWTRGAVDTVACRKTPRGKRQSQRSRPRMKVAGYSRLRCRVGWRRLGLGRACQHRPTRSLHPGLVGEPATRRRLLDLVPEATLRHTPNGSPFVTDEGHHPLDCTLPPGDLEPVATALKATLGVVNHGHFLTHPTRSSSATRTGR
jgi:hypothetical protein